MIRQLMIVLLFACVPLVAAQEPESEEGNIADPYDLFDPVPKSLMRPMTTDRPNVTESPRTVDAGHFQFEIDLFRYGKEKSGSSDVASYLFGGVNIKAGLNIDADFEVIVESYRIVKSGGVEKSGFGDVTPRFKFNLFGNDKGAFAAAVLPFVKIPTNSGTGNNRVEGGVYFPIEWNPDEIWSVGFQIGPEFASNLLNNKYHFEFLGSLSVSPTIAKRWAPFVEATSRTSTETKLTAWRLGGGLVYEIVENFRVDAGAYFALNAEAEDFTFFTGTSFRF